MTHNPSSLSASVADKVDLVPSSTRPTSHAAPAGPILAVPTSMSSSPIHQAAISNDSARHNLDSTLSISQTSNFNSPAVSEPVSAPLTSQPELSPLCIPAVSVSPSSPPMNSGQTTLVHSPSSPSSRLGDCRPRCAPSNPNDSSSDNKSTSFEEGELEESETSEVEIYLSSLGLENAAPCVRTSTVAGPEQDLEAPPVVPQNTQIQEPTPSVTIIHAKQVSPQMPPAPVQQTIPLPDVTSECEDRTTPVQSTPSVYQHVLPSSVVVSNMTSPNAEMPVTNVVSDSSAAEIQDKNFNDCIDLDNSHKTPNVYINGLPPHFPEEQLYALAAPYGPIRSVRTFTRHVKESESGYGFVLFETIDSAERCILSLRRYRNLHPTFSKQIHKIPGIAYTPPPPSSSQDSLQSNRATTKGNEGGELSFKEKMESLHDPMSTNLYMEGLPLSIDEPTLAALVSPHRISSSRFFQTRLSSPPRIIAFVRLETRVGAEEIIERLHGRMVRGWNDTGSRISVRFADTAEQRELRRTERATKEGEQSPARLTIAQAALLNMRGQELRQRTSPMMPTHQSLPEIDRLNKLRDQILYPEFSSNAHSSPNTLSVDYGLAPNSNYVSPRLHTPPLPTSYRSGNVQSSRSFHGNDYLGPDSDLQYNLRSQVPNRPIHALDEFGITNQQYPMRNGYTAAEEYIMRAHAEFQRRRQPALDTYRRRRSSDANANINLGVRGCRAQASTIVIPQQKVFSSTAVLDSVTNCEPFNPSNTIDLRTRIHQQDMTKEPARHLSNIHANVRLSREPTHAKPSQSPQISPDCPSLLVQNPDQYHQGHLRSSTLPHRSAPATQHQRHHQHSSLSVTSTNSARHSQDTISAILSNMNQNNSLTSYKNQSERMISHASNDRQDAKNIKGATLLEQRGNPNLHETSGSNSYEHNQASPSLTSPALTYSSNHTPSTLSPATPFFGSFSSQSEGFEQAGSHVADSKKCQVSQG